MDLDEKNQATECLWVGATDIYECVQFGADPIQIC